MKPGVAAMLGQVLLWIGFLGGAFAAVFRLENPQSPWQTVPWNMYLASAAIGVVGVVILRRERAAQRMRSAASEVGMDSVVGSLGQVADKVAHFALHIEDKTCEQVLEFIDDECAAGLAAFADGRMVISNRLGTVTYAAVMTEFASGERYLNRAWSAAADGYVDEVASAMQIASTFLSSAHQDLLFAIDQFKEAGSAA